MPMLLLGPFGIFPSEWQTTLNCPSNHLQSSDEVNFPPGPIGPGLISPSAVHFPTKYASRSCSGPGFAAWGDWAVAESAPATETTTQVDSTLNSLLMGPPAVM